MTDTETDPTEPARTSDDTADAADSALRPAGSDLHPADTADDLTANTPAGSAEPAPAAEAGDLPAGDGSAEPGDRLPGTGSAAPEPGSGDADALRTVESGREAAAARVSTSDTVPTPTGTPVERPEARSPRPR